MKYELRKNLPVLPLTMQHLPVSASGYPIPYFVAYIEGLPDFRVLDPDAMNSCVSENRCWVCGGKLGKVKTFVSGPLIALNRTSAEPPMHHECAEFAVKACPFMLLPKAKRREANLPAEVHADYSPGVLIMENPGVFVLYDTLSFDVIRSPGGQFFAAGQPSKVSWYADGSPATLAQAKEALRLSTYRMLESVGITEGGADIPRGDFTRLMNMVINSIKLLPVQLAATESTP